MTWFFLFLSLGLGVAGQLLLKKGVGAPGGMWQSPAVWVGFGAYGIGSLIWLAVLSRLPLNLAYPVLALGYVLVVVASRFLFGERITWSKAIGCTLIVVGVWILAMGFPAK